MWYAWKGPSTPNLISWNSSVMNLWYDMLLLLFFVVFILLMVVILFVCLFVSVPFTLFLWKWPKMALNIKLLRCNWFAYICFYIVYFQGKCVAKNKSFKCSSHNLNCWLFSNKKLNANEILKSELTHVTSHDILVNCNWKYY